MVKLYKSGILAKKKYYINQRKKYNNKIHSNFGTQNSNIKIKIENDIEKKIKFEKNNLSRNIFCNYDDEIHKTFPINNSRRNYVHNSNHLHLQNIITKNKKLTKVHNREKKKNKFKFYQNYL